MKRINEIYNKDDILLYRGELKNEKRDGFGESFYDDGKLKYRGLWKNDKIYIPPFPKTLKLFKKNIGKGGQGSVSIYQDEKTRKLFAVKKYNREKVGIRQYLNLEYLNYMDICKKSYTCPFGLYKKNDSLYLVMNYLKNYSNLSDIKVKENERILICQEIWNEVQKLHDNNIVHCDLKPQNIMVDTDTLNVAIIDFGGAIVLSNNTKEKYSLTSTTRTYLKINKYKKHTAKALKSNDNKTIIHILYCFLFQKKNPIEDKLMKSELKKYIRL